MSSQRYRERAEQETVPYVSPSILETILSQSALPILVSFQTSWAEGIIPRLREIVEAFAGEVQPVRVDVTAHPSLRERFKIRVIPTLLVFQHGLPVGFIVGLAPSRFIIETLRKATGAASRERRRRHGHDQMVAEIKTHLSNAGGYAPLPIRLRTPCHGYRAGATPRRGCSAKVATTYTCRLENGMANVSKRLKNRNRKAFYRQQRSCLRCDQEFPSAGPHNRLCEACRAALTAAATPEEEHPLVFLRESRKGH